MNKGFGILAGLLFATTTWVHATEPTVAPKNLTISNVTCGSATISWSKGDGPFTTILIKEGSAVDAPPTDGTWPTAFSTFGSGSQFGTGNYVCYNDMNATFTVTGLQMGKTYYVCAYTNDGVSQNVDYLTSSFVCTSFTTASVSLDFDYKYINLDSCQNSNELEFFNKSSVTYSGAKFIWRMYNSPPGFDQLARDAGQNKDSVHYKWTKPGVKLVELFLVPAYGCNGIVKKSLLIYPRTKPGPYVVDDDTVQCYDYGNSHFFFNENTSMDPTPKSSFQRQWFIDTFTFTVPNPDLKGLAAGKYKVTYVGKSLYDSKLTPCFDTSYVYIRVVADPTSGITINDSIQCYTGNKFDFDNVFPGLIAFNWDFGDFTANQTTKTCSHTYANKGNYYVTHRATSPEGCVSQVKRLVQVKPNVDPSFTGLPSNLCEGADSVEMNPVTSGGIFSGQFVRDSFFNPKTPGTYIVKHFVPDSFCPDSATKTIVVDPLPRFSLGADQVICNGGTLQMTINATGTYLWDDFTTNQTRTVSQGGSYWGRVTNKGCVWTDTLDVFLGTTPTIKLDLPDDTILCKGAVLHLHAFWPGSKTTWSTGQTDTSIYVTSEGTYIVTVSNPCGVARDTVRVYYAGDYCDLFVPDAFTPNRDGRNEVFQILGRGITPKMFLIYNRWGQCVFDSRTTGTFGWDGTYMQEDCMDGLYSYLFYYEVKSGNIIRRNMLKGAVLLYR